MQKIGEFGCAADQLASLMERYRLHGASVPRCYRTVEEGGGALHTREKQLTYLSCGLLGSLRLQGRHGSRNWDRAGPLAATALNVDARTAQRSCGSNKLHCLLAKL